MSDLFLTEEQFANAKAQAAINDDAFWKFVEQALETKPRLTLADFRIIKFFGATQQFMSSGDKTALIADNLRIMSEYNLQRRQFYVATGRELEHLLGLYLSDEKEASALAYDRIERGQHIILFKPSDPNDQPPEIMFSILITSDKVITPITIAYRQIPRKTPVESIEADPLYLFKTWSTKTITEYFRYLQYLNLSERERLQVGG